VSKSDHPVGGLLAADDFDALHDRNGVHEVDADYLLRSVRRTGDGRDGEPAGVGRQDRILVRDCFEVREDVLFNVHILDDRLDDDVTVSHVAEVGRAGDAITGIASVRFRQLVAVDHAVEAIVDGLEAAVDELLFDVAHHDVVSRYRGDLAIPLPIVPAPTTPTLSRASAKNSLFATHPHST